MTPNQIGLVQRSWNQVVPMGEAAVLMFYERLFFVDPSLRLMFRGDMKRQSRKVLEMITFTVAGLSRIDEIVPVVQSLGRRHAVYGTRDEHYVTVGAALLWTLEQGLGAAFTPAVREAWAAAYALLANTMKDAAKVMA
jgi:hemoglobin-like flavoprotein